MKIAIYKNIQHDFETICKEDFECLPNYTRITEFVDVEFPRLPLNAEQEIAAIERCRSETVQRHEAELQRLDKRKAKLQGELPECTCLCPTDKTPGPHHSLKCAARTNGVAA